MSTYLPHPTSANTPSRKTRKSERSKVFMKNKMMARTRRKKLKEEVNE